MSDKREATRKKLMAFTPVYDANKKILLGYVKNLSLRGIMMVGEKTVEINTEKVLKIEFPNDLPEIISSHITIPTRVVWCRQGENPRYFDTGFEFTEVIPEQAMLFQEILLRYQFRQDMPL